MHFIAVFFSFFFISQVNALEPFSAHYTLYFKGVEIGKGVRRLSKKADHYLFESQAHSTGFAAMLYKAKILETSTFKWLDKQFIPLNYRYDYQTKKRTKQMDITFDWHKKQAENHSASQPWQVGIKEGVSDKLLYQLQVMQDLAVGKRDLSYVVADKGKLKSYQPAFLGEEKVKTGVGELNTLKYRYVSENKKRSTTLWCAPKFQYLPVRVEHIEKGDSLEMRLQQVEGL